MPMLLLPVTPHHRRTGLPELLQQHQVRLHGPLELAHLVRHQGILEEEGRCAPCADTVAPKSGAVLTIPTCLRPQAPDLGGGRQAHLQWQWERKVLTEELTQAGMVLARPQ